METIAETYREAIVEIANDLLDTPSIKYKQGHPELGQSPEAGFDCSGFVTFVLTQAGLTIPDFIGMDNTRRPIRHANEYWDHYGVAVHDGLQTSGDLVFFSRHGIFPTHIGIVWDETSYIHAPGKDSTKVGLAPLDTEAIVGVAGVGKQLYEKNPIGFKSIVKPATNFTYRYHQEVI